MKRIAAILLILCMASCSDKDGATAALIDAGYKNIEITGISWFGCGRDDAYATGFVAVSPGGARVSGVVCSMSFSGSTTIRTFGRV